MKVTFQIPEILVLSGCLSLVFTSSTFEALALLGSGLAIGFIRWSLDLAREQEGPVDPKKKKG